MKTRYSAGHDFPTTWHTGDPPVRTIAFGWRTAPTILHAGTVTVLNTVTIAPRFDIQTVRVCAWRAEDSEFS